MSIKDKFNKFRDSVNATIDKYNTAENRSKLASISTNMERNFGGGFGGFGSGPDYSMKPRSKPKRRRSDEFDRDERDIHIHIRMPRRPRY